jgi:hypothetical protein
MNYGELKTAIEDYCQNSESTFVANMNNFIIAAEDRVFGALDTPYSFQEEATVTLSSGEADYDLGSNPDFLNLAGVLEILSIRISESATGQSGGVEYGPARYLLKKDYDFLLEAYPGSASAATQGKPKYYAVPGSSIQSNSSASHFGAPTLKIRLGPIPNTTYQATVTYYRKRSEDSITNNSVDSNVTWLSSTFPDCLMYGSIIQAYTFMKGEPDMIQLYEKHFMDSLTIARNVMTKSMANDSYRPGSMPQVKG